MNSPISIKVYYQTYIHCLGIPRIEVRKYPIAKWVESAERTIWAMLERLYTTIRGNVLTYSSSSLETNRIYSSNGNHQGSTTEIMPTTDGAYSNSIEHQNLSQQSLPTSSADISILPPPLSLPTLNEPSLLSIPETKQLSTSTPVKKIETEKGKTQTSSTSTNQSTRQTPAVKASKQSSSINASTDCIQEVEKRKTRTPSFPILTERWAVVCQTHNM